jgi:hypothetical protein
MSIEKYLQKAILSKLEQRSKEEEEGLLKQLDLAHSTDKER